MATKRTHTIYISNAIIAENLGRRLVTPSAYHNIDLKEINDQQRVSWFFEGIKEAVFHTHFQKYR